MRIKPRIWIRGISITEKHHISLVTVMIISQKESVIKFYKEVGFTLKRKQEKLEKAIIEMNWLEDIQHPYEKERNIQSTKCS